MPAYRWCLIFAAFFLYVIAVGTASAQVPANNPYRAAANGKSVWPPYYKTDPEDAKYMKLMAGGWCRTSGIRAREYLFLKSLDVNALPESSLAGAITKLESGQLIATDEKTGLTVELIAHGDPSISRVCIRGTTSIEALIPNGFIRFVGKVDEAGLLRETIDQIEITDPAARQVEPITPNKLQNIFGSIVRRDQLQLTLAVAPAGKRKLAVTLAPQVKVDLQTVDFRYVGTGDQATAKGRIYRAPAPERSLFFCDEIEIVSHRTGELSPSPVFAKP